MRYTLFGRTGPRVSEPSLGTMTFGEDWGWGAAKEAGRRIVDAYADAGGNFIDTASSYTDGSSETILGELLADRRESFVLASKYTCATRKDDVRTPSHGSTRPARCRSASRMTSSGSRASPRTSTATAGPISTTAAPPTAAPPTRSARRSSVPLSA
ncbi:aldo/keto reductase [Streptomyces sp. NPDC005336]|uniref:aldo/keto reductase n=1 Tax=Streptomyces sp. NPDC005336 TaxID=3157035 RepID=UPI0033B25E45